MKTVEKIIWVIALIAIVVLIGVVGYGYYQKATYKTQNPLVTMEVENFGTIKMELYPEQAPETVANFITLANRGFYNGLTFHRVVKDFMIQGGDKEGTGQGSATLADLKDDGDSNTDYSIKGEFVANGVNNTLKFDEGIIGMARNDYTQYSSSLKEESYNSGSCQFFIVTKAASYLFGQYTGFGKVIQGLDVVHKIEEVEVKAADTSSETESSSNSEASTPVNAPVITSIRVETNGVDYGEPETLKPFDYSSYMNQLYGGSTY